MNHIDDEQAWPKYVAMLVHSAWASTVLLHRSPVPSHSKFNYMAGLCKATCLIAMKLVGGPRDDTASGHDG